MKEFKEYLDVAWEFHGHRYPAMPMGLRAGFAAMHTLGVERSKDKELFVEAQTGKGHGEARGKRCNNQYFLHMPLRQCGTS